MTGISKSLSQQGSDGGDSWPGKRLPSRNTLSGSTRRNAIELDELIRKGKHSAQLMTKARIPLEGGRIGCGRRLERRPDRRGAGHQHRHGRADQAPAGRGRVRGGPGPQIQFQLRPATDFRRRGGSKTDRADPLSGPRGLLPDGACVCFEEKVVELHIVERASDNTIGRTLKKNSLKPHRKQQWVIPPDKPSNYPKN